MTSTKPLKIAYITAGAGGMFCGSCLHDNTLARALSRMPDVECLLVPTYTPIRTDEDDVSVPRVFLGGINVYLEQRLPLVGYLPSWATRWLDHPRLLRWVASRAIKMPPQQLGALTVSMLRGTHGRQRREMRALCRWLAEDLQPDVVILSNILIAGFLPELRRHINAKIVVTLQGDDIFLRELPAPYQLDALREIRRLGGHVDAFLTYSRYYADFMSSYLELPREKFHLTPLGVDTRDFQALPPPAEARPPTIGYLARLAPEKGLHILVDAFIELRARGHIPGARLAVAGWLGEHRREYVDQQLAKLRAAGLTDSVEMLGTVDRAGKLALLREIDVLSVPTTYQDPKGLFVLEALAAGKPVVQPAHGAFPELLHATGGGRLVRPLDPSALAFALEELLLDREQCRQLGAAGQRAVLQHFHAEAMARHVLQILGQLAAPVSPSAIAVNT